MHAAPTVVPRSTEHSDGHRSAARSARAWRRSVTPLALAAAFTLGLTACSPGGTDTTQPSTPATSEASVAPSSSAACAAVASGLDDIRTKLSDLPSMIPDDVDGAVGVVTGIGEQLSAMQQAAASDATLSEHIGSVQAALGTLAASGESALNAANPLTSIPDLMAAYGEVQDSFGALLEYCGL